MLEWWTIWLPWQLISVNAERVRASSNGENWWRSKSGQRFGMRPIGGVECPALVTLGLG